MGKEGIICSDSNCSLGEQCAHITGYVQNISAEELKKHKKDGYTETSLIGKTGLEYVYESALKPQRDGYEIRILDNDNKLVEVIAEQKPVNGNDIYTTIDVNAQQLVYDNIKNEAGSGVMLDAHTGEVLAMVSAPGFDPNDFVLGVREDKWKAYNDPAKTPLVNRNTSAFTPGSTFKAISGAIGLDTKTIEPSTVFEKTDKWQKDKSWGNNYVTTTQGYQEPSNLKNAFINSDNIYFAQLADKIGVTDYKTYLDDIGFNKKFDFPLAVARSTYGTLDHDQKLAAAGYGQGELQISPLHLTALYTAYKNDGNILKPYIIYDDHKTKLLRKHAYTKETAETVFNDLQSCMDYYGDNPTHAGAKTGTAQIQNGEKEIGWLCAVNDKIALTIMIDDTKDIGESHYVLPIARTILNNYK